MSAFHKMYTLPSVYIFCFGGGVTAALKLASLKMLLIGDDLSTSFLSAMSKSTVGVFRFVVSGGFGAAPLCLGSLLSDDVGGGAGASSFPSSDFPVTTGECRGFGTGSLSLVDETVLKIL